MPSQRAVTQPKSRPTPEAGGSGRARGANYFRASRKFNGRCRADDVGGLAVPWKIAIAQGTRPEREGGTAIARDDHKPRSLPMPMRFESTSAVVSTTVPRTQSMRARVCPSTAKCPVFNLTLPQAARLFSLDRSRCAHVLSTLVKRGALVTNGRGFTRCQCGAPFRVVNVP